MERLNLITSKEYWVEVLENANYNKLSNESIAENIVDKINEALALLSVGKSVKEKYTLTFEEWKMKNVWLKRGNSYFLEAGQEYSYGDMIKRWKKETNQP